MSIKLTYKITFIDDTVREIQVVDFMYEQAGFLVMQLPNFEKEYIKTSSIATIHQSFKLK